MTVVAADTSPLIALAQTDTAHLLPALFSQVVVPEAVWRELAGPAGTVESAVIGALPGLRMVPDLPGSAELEGLGRGEVQAILHAQALKCPVLLDDHAARQRAKALKIPVLGSLRVLVEGKRRGYLVEVAPIVEALRARGYRLGDEVVRRTLAEAGELG